MKRERTSSLFGNKIKDHLLNYTSRDYVKASSIQNMKNKAINNDIPKLEKSKISEITKTPTNRSVDRFEIQSKNDPIEMIRRTKNALNQNGVVALDKR